MSEQDPSRPTAPARAPRPLGVRLPNVTRYRLKCGERWRARMRIGGHDFVGPLRETAEEAFGDVPKLRELRGLSARAKSREGTIGRVLERVVADAADRGLTEETIRNQYRSGAAAILSFWHEDVPLGVIDRTEVEAFVREARAAGRAPGTVRKYLLLLTQAFMLAGLESPVPIAKARMRTALKAQKAPTRAPSLAEVAAAIHRIRTERFTHTLRGHVQATAMRSRDYAAALVEFLAMTGIRGGEMGRLEVRDLDLERGTVTVRVAKDRSNPRTLPIPLSTLPAARILVAAAEGDRILAGGMVGLTTMLKRWQARLALPWLNARMLRHSYGTALAAGGASLAAVMQGLGHRSPRSAQHYIDVGKGELASFANSLGAALHAGTPAASEEREAS